jgi:hypothetical protein
LDDLSPNDKLTPQILSQWIRAKGESFGSVYLVNFSAQIIWQIISKCM